MAVAHCKRISHSKARRHALHGQVPGRHPRGRVLEDLHVRRGEGSAATRRLRQKLGQGGCGKARPAHDAAAWHLYVTQHVRRPLGVPDPLGNWRQEERHGLECVRAELQPSSACTLEWFEVLLEGVVELVGPPKRSVDRRKSTSGELLLLLQLLVRLLAAHHQIVWLLEDLLTRAERMARCRQCSASGEGRAGRRGVAAA